MMTCFFQQIDKVRTNIAAMPSDKDLHLTLPRLLFMRGFHNAPTRIAPAIPYLVLSPILIVAAETKLEGWTVRDIGLTQVGRRMTTPSTRCLSWAAST